MAMMLSMLKSPRRSLLMLGFVRAVMLVLAVIIISFTQLAPDVTSVEPIAFDECMLNISSKSDLELTGMPKPTLSFIFPPFWAPKPAFSESKNLSMDVFKYLMGSNMLKPGARALCIGEGSSSAVSSLSELGLYDVFGVEKHPYFSLLRWKFVYELNFEDKHFDFVFLRNLDCSPAIVLREIERVLRPGGVGAVLVASHYSENLINSANTFNSILKSSNVVHSCRFGPFLLVILQKRTNHFASFEHIQLPPDCPSIAMNKPFMKYIEPLNGRCCGSSKGEVAYLPKFMNISSRNRLIYMNIGAGGYARPSIQKISELYAVKQDMAFDKYVVHYIPSITYTYVPEPGINLVFYRPPGEEATSVPEFVSEDDMDDFIDEEDFDFMKWLKETVSGGNFVILMMDAKTKELSILEEIFSTGAICYVDELFLRCSDQADCIETMDILRQRGVYAHQHFL